MSFAMLALLQMEIIIPQRGGLEALTDLKEQAGMTAANRAISYTRFPYK
ncbi:hypothetical protein [Uliginosibacterium flavum]